MRVANAKQLKAISEMFVAFGNSSDAERMATYTKMLEDIPAEVLQKVCLAAMEKHKFLPSIAELLDDARSLMGAVDPSLNVVPFAMAWEEIQKQMNDAFVYQKPEFSRTEIQAAVDAFGWMNLCETKIKDMPTVRAQMRRIYEDICAEAKESRVNNHVLGKGDMVEGLSVGRIDGLLKGGVV